MAQFQKANISVKEGKGIGWGTWQGDGKQLPLITSAVVETGGSETETSLSMGFTHCLHRVSRRTISSVETGLATVLLITNITSQLTMDGTSIPGFLKYFVQRTTFT